MKFDKKVFSWAMYDWANSAFSTTIMAGFFPIFFKEFWSAGAEPTLTTARLGTTISISGLIMFFMSPMLGTLSDIKDSKKIYLLSSMIIGAVACYYLSLITKGDWSSAMLTYGIAILAFEFSTIFYDSLLPSVAPGIKSSNASSLGFSLGYLGGGILFAINVLMFLNPSSFGLTDGVTAVKLSFVTVSLWWFLFTLPLLLFVPEPKNSQPKTNFVEALKLSLKKLSITFKKIRIENKNTALFLVAFWFYYDGVNTVITMAVDFGKSLGFQTGDLITALLITQFIGFPFAILFGYIATKIGCKIPIMFAITVYSIMVFGALFMSNSTHFLILACVIGMVQGCVQALSRSLFSQMIPKGEEGEYFGLYNVIGKFASIIGPLLVGFGALLSGSNRLGILSLLILFIFGGFILTKVKEPKPI